MLTTYEERNGSQCKPTKNQKAIDACPSNICSCYAYALREEEEAKSPELLEVAQWAERYLRYTLRDIESGKPSAKHYNRQVVESELAWVRQAIAKATA